MYPQGSSSSAPIHVHSYPINNCHCVEEISRTRSKRINYGCLNTAGNQTMADTTTPSKHHTPPLAHPHSLTPSLAHPHSLTPSLAQHHSLTPSLAHPRGLTPSLAHPPQPHTITSTPSRPHIITSTPSRPHTTTSTPSQPHAITSTPLSDQVCVNNRNAVLNKALPIHTQPVSVNHIAASATQ